MKGAPLRCRARPASKRPRLSARVAFIGLLACHHAADIFGARDVAGVALPSIDHVIQLTASPAGAVFFRAYTLSFKRADGKVPRLELSLMGPSMDWEIRRVQRPSSDLAKYALKVPAQ